MHTSQMPAPLELTGAQFNQISRMTQRLCGVNLHNGKEELVRSRLVKRLRALKMTNFNHYIRFVRQDRSGRELSRMIDALTTHKTNFFREPEHFEFLRSKALPTIKSDRIRIWSAGCSSGEEPFTIAITLLEELPDNHHMDVRILATDISITVLEKARQAEYEEDILGEVKPLVLQKYFTCARFKKPRIYRLNPNAKSLVKFAQLNLMSEWPMKGPFDIIFCRNVMIYFDKPTQYRLIQRFGQLLRKGGYLFVGHSESLAVLSHPFHYVQPAVYVK